MFAKTRQAFADAADRRQMRRELRAARRFDDRILNDIGITRANLEEAIRSL